MTSTTYKITVVKRSIESAAKNTNVYVTLYGEQGNSGERFLNDERNNLEQQKRDVFSIDSQELGNIEKIKIRYDNGGKKHEFLTSVFLHNEKTGKEWVCPLNRWLVEKEDDAGIDRELNCSKV